MTTTEPISGEMIVMRRTFEMIPGNLQSSITTADLCFAGDDG
jgi:hypothetical protein